MTNSAETAQYERDLRSAKKEWQRTKDSSVKWSHGSRHLPGISFDGWGATRNGANTPEHMWAKSRPEKRPSESDHRHIKNQNIVKPRSAWDMPDSRRRVAHHIKGEMLDASSSFSLDSNSPLASPSLARSLGGSITTAAAADPFLYSFDRTDTPGGPLTLEVFVKKGTGRETEKLVEREYEVLDGNGEAVRGRRARAVLRKAGNGSSSGKGDGKDGDGGDGREDEGFELV